MYIEHSIAVQILCQYMYLHTTRCPLKVERSPLTVCISPISAFNSCKHTIMNIMLTYTIHLLHTYMQHYTYTYEHMYTSIHIYIP